jgi:hypothetical protein
MSKFVNRSHVYENKGSVNSQTLIDPCANTRLNSSIIQTIILAVPAAIDTAISLD